MIPGRYTWVDFTFGRVTQVFATIALSVTCAVKVWMWVFISALFLLIHTVINVARDRNIVRRLGKNYEQVQRRAVQIISDLGRISHFDLWIVDIYLLLNQWTFVRRLPLLKRQKCLSRQLSVSLIDALHQTPSSVNLSSSSPYVECFNEIRPLLLYDHQVHGSYAGNGSIIMYEQADSDLYKVHGVLSIFPLVDQNKKHCVGVIAIHVKPEQDLSLKALGVLQSELGRYNINNACVDLNGLLRQ